MAGSPSALDKTLGDSSLVCNNFEPPAVPPDRHFCGVLRTKPPPRMGIDLATGWLQSGQGGRSARGDPWHGYRLLPEEVGRALRLRLRCFDEVIRSGSFASWVHPRDTSTFITSDHHPLKSKGQRKSPSDHPTRLHCLTPSVSPVRLRQVEAPCLWVQVESRVALALHFTLWK